MMIKQVHRKEIQVHDYDRRIQNTLRMIDEELSERNAKLIRQYQKEIVRNSLSKATELKHLSVCLNLSRMLKKDWHDVTKQDIDELIYNIMIRYSKNGQETHSSWDHKKILKIFFRWFKLGLRDSRQVGDPPETKQIRLKPIKSKLAREQLITEQDISSLLKATINPRDRAFIDVHYEAGTRPGEILSLKIKHVKTDNFGAFIYVDGKTGSRPIRLVRSVPNLMAWLDSHPFKNDPESPLWINLEQTRLGQPLNYFAAEAILKRAVRRSGLHKKVNLKLFRHSEATNSAKFLNEAQMRMRHGWTASSKMPENYVHLIQADVDDAYLKHFGIKQDDTEPTNLPRICHICKTPNSPESDLCNRCGKALDLKKALKLEEKTNEQNFAANKLAGNVLVQMLMTGKIPKISQDEMNLLISTLNL
ncbi:MAG: site-specific integrase [Candidatus Nitrosotenuis sp.]|nr:site-specific integrase [Candidatus Nitrosotenuis sp.]